LSLRRPAIGAGSVHVGFVVNKMLQGQVISPSA